MNSSLTSSTEDKMVTRPDLGLQLFVCQPDSSVLISAQVSAGKPDREFYAVNRQFQTQFIIIFPQIYLAAWGRKVHPSSTLVPSLLAMCCNYLLWHSRCLCDKQACYHSPHQQQLEKERILITAVQGQLSFILQRMGFFFL